MLRKSCDICDKHLQTIEEQKALLLVSEEKIRKLNNQIHTRDLMIEDYRKLSRTCPLTGLANRLAFDETYQKFVGLLPFKEDKRNLSNFALGVMFIDIDDFKKINDDHGHSIGDIALRVVGRAISGVVRKSDLVARYGGEEIVVILPNINSATAAILAERVRSVVASCMAPLVVTVSIGVACAKHRGSISLVEEADKAMYLAKNAGKNVAVFRGINPDDTFTDFFLNNLNID